MEQFDFDMQKFDMKCFDFLKFYLLKINKNKFLSLKSSMLYQSNILSRYSQLWLDILSEYIKKYINLREEEIMEYLEYYQNISPHYYVRFYNLYDNILWYIETEYESKFKYLLQKWIEE
jgi:hypothetical protein